MTGDRGRKTEEGPKTEDGGPKTGDPVGYKFQNLDVYKLALDYLDAIYDVIGKLPESEKFNLSSQIVRAATSVVLNIAEGSTGQSDAEQNRFLGLALRSYIETIACLDIIGRRTYLSDNFLTEVKKLGHQVFVKLQAFRKSLEISVASPRSPVNEVPVATVPGQNKVRSSVSGPRSPVKQVPVASPRSPVREKP